MHQLIFIMIVFLLSCKTQIQEMVKRLLNLPALPGPDAADALGMAITHAHSMHVNKVLLDRGRA